MNRKCGAALATALFVMAGQSASASSVALPEAVWTTFVLTNTGQNQSNLQTPSSPVLNYTQNAADGWGGAGVATVSTSVTPALTVKSTVTALGTQPFFGNATAPYMETRATLNYSIAIVGPGGGNVALNVSGNGAVSTPNNQNASAGVFLGLGLTGAIGVNYTPVVGLNVQNNVVLQDGSQFTDYISGPISGFSYSHTFSAPVNSIINVSMSVLADDNGAPLLASSYAYLDPFFSVADDRYSILTSPGILNVTSAVPEPSTWAMMMLGFCGLGVWSRRRRNFCRA